MMQTSLPTLAAQPAKTELFYYRNVTSQIQIVRVDQSTSERFEKVVFPGEQILFYSTLESSFDVYTPTSTGLTLAVRVPCAQLRVLVTA